MLCFQIFIEALCHGNLSEDEAVKISNIFKNSLTVEPLPSKCRHGEQITCFPLGAKLVRDVNVKNKSETNSVVEVKRKFSFLVMRVDHEKNIVLSSGIIMVLNLNLNLICSFTIKSSLKNLNQQE